MLTKYAILARTTRLQSFTAQIADLENTSLDVQNFTVAGGTLIKIVQDSEIPDEPSVTNTVKVYIYDEVIREPNTERIYQCTSDSLLPVSDNLWPFLLSIPEANRRLVLALDTFRCDWLNVAMPGDLVTVTGRCFEQQNNVRYEGIVCYIGPVPEIHPVGYFIGLELLNAITSPQAADIPFTRKYFECEPADSIFTTGDRIIPTPPQQEEEPEVADETSSSYSWSILNSFSGAIDYIRDTLL